MIFIVKNLLSRDDIVSLVTNVELYFTQMFVLRGIFFRVEVPFNYLKCSGVRWLHLDVFCAIQVYTTFLISDIRPLWRSGLSARVAECQKLEI